MNTLLLRRGKRYITIAGPSGGGKSTICKLLLQRFKNLVHSISHTTRERREGEVEGKDYFFISDKAFKKLIDTNKMVEWAKVHGNYYGTSKKFLADSLLEKKIVLLDIDVQGVESFRKIYPDETISIFLMPPNMKTLEKRLRARGTDSDEIIHTRLENAKKEIERSVSFDYQVVNDDLDTTFDKICAILEKELGVR